MKQLNKLRLNAGIPIDPSIEITEKEQITEARETPRRKMELKPADGKFLKKQVRGVEQAVKHLVAAINALEKIPATDFSGDVPRFIGELEDLLDEGGSTGMEAYLEKIASDLRKLDGGEKKAKRKEEEEEKYAGLESGDEEECEMKEDEDIGDFIKHLSDIQRDQLMVAVAALKLVDTDAMIRENAFKVVSDLMGNKLEEGMHYYNVEYSSHGNDKNKPINVVDGTTNDEQVWDEEEEKLKKEGPEQLKTMDQQDNSPQDKSSNDLDTKVKVPSSIKQELRAEIDKARKEATVQDSRNKDASYFYKDLANAFEDLLGHLEKGTRYDMKQAQVFAQTLMGPMLHKIPPNVWKFLTNGGETRSLKSYMQEVGKQYPITGPRNTLK